MPTKSKPSGFKSILSASGQAKKSTEPAAEPVLPAPGRRMKAGYVQVGANIPRALKREVFKLLQDEDGVNFSSLVENLLENWVKTRQ